MCYLEIVQPINNFLLNGKGIIYGNTKIITTRGETAEICTFVFSVYKEFLAPGSKVSLTSLFEAFKAVLPPAMWSISNRCVFVVVKSVFLWHPNQIQQWCHSVLTHPGVHCYWWHCTQCKQKHFQAVYKYIYSPTSKSTSGILCNTWSQSKVTGIIDFWYSSFKTLAKYLPNFKPHEAAFMN